MPNIVYICPECGALLTLHGDKVQCQECHKIVKPKPVAPGVWAWLAKKIIKQKNEEDE